MKKLLLLMFMLMLCLLLSSCFWGVDNYAGERLSDHVNTRWVSNDPDIYFEVREEGLIYGEITIDGMATEIIVSMGPPGNNVEFSDKLAYIVDEHGNEGTNADMWLFIGSGKFSENSFVVKIFNNKKGFLDESIKEITFIKEDIS